MNRSSDIKELLKALHKVQKIVGSITANAENPAFKKDGKPSTYASLPAVLDEIRKPLNDNGIILIQGYAVSDSEVTKAALNTLITTLFHVESGQYIESEVILNPVKNDPQGVGAATTYYRRFSLAAMLGLAQVDDDGNSSSNPPKPTEPPKVAPKQSVVASKVVPKAQTSSKVDLSLYGLMANLDGTVGHLNTGDHVCCEAPLSDNPDSEPCYGFMKLSQYGPQLYCGRNAKHKKMELSSFLPEDEIEDLP